MCGVATLLRRRTHLHKRHKFKLESDIVSVDFLVPFKIQGEQCQVQLKTMKKSRT